MTRHPRQAVYASSVSAGLLLVLTVAFLSGLSANAQLPSAERGRLLYENHCQFCHTQKIHARPNKVPFTRGQLRAIVDDWRRQQDLRWTGEDIEDVVEYLNRTRYHFSPAE